MTADMESPKKTEKRSEVLVLLGPSLNMLGVREPEKYGSKSCAELVDFCVKTGSKLGLDVTVKQSNWGRGASDVDPRREAALGHLWNSLGHWRSDAHLDSSPRRAPSRQDPMCRSPLD